MSEDYLLAAARYIERNPVRAGLAPNAEEYPWSSASAHIKGKSTELLDVIPLLELVPNWKEFLSQPLPEEQRNTLRTHERTGRPLGTKEFVNQLETLLVRKLDKEKPGPKPTVSMN